jgi:aconitate hydratase A / 2-methylisocitrate dehydratase
MGERRRGVPVVRGTLASFESSEPAEMDALSRIDPFGARAPLAPGLPDVYRLDAIAERTGGSDLPVTVRILLENVLRHAGGGIVDPADVETLASWRPRVAAEAEVPFMPSRVIMQDLTGVPAVVDLAVMRDAMADLGGDPGKVNPLVPADLVIDHSVQVDRFATSDAFAFNVEREYERNGERYQLLRWAQTAFHDLRIVPPGTGIVHQVNLEFLAPVVAERDGVAFPDTLVGTDSHTTMINALGVLGYGVGGIEAEAVLLGQPLYQPMPHVVGVRLIGELPQGSTATDLVLVVTEMLRAHGVVGAFVEFAGDGLAGLSLADRATISNMSPEFGATSTLFPIDDETLSYLRLTGRSPERVDLVERYAKEQGLWREPGAGPTFDELLTLDLGTVEPSVAGHRIASDSRICVPTSIRRSPTDSMARRRSPARTPSTATGSRRRRRSPSRRRMRRPLRRPRWPSRRRRRRRTRPPRPGKPPTVGSTRRCLSRSAARPRPSAPGRSPSRRSRRAPTRRTRRS